MTGALLAVAAAILLWPDPASVRRSRMNAVSGRPAAHRLRPEIPLPVVAATVAGGVGAVAGTRLVAVLAAGLAFLLARAWVAARVERRSEEEVRRLTEGLAVLAAELRSGRSLVAAADAAAAAVPDALAGRALAAAVRTPGVVAGSPIGSAVRAALERISAGAALSARTGCSLATVLTAVEDDLRARARHRVELRTSTAGPRAGAAVLAGLPVLGLAMGSGVGADPWRVLTTTGTGQVLLVAGAALEVAGVWWSRWLVERAVR